MRMAAMGAIIDLWKSERGLIAVALIAAATALCGLSVITVQQWLDYTKWIFVTYAAAKTITGSVGIVSAQPSKPTTGWKDVEPLVTAFLSTWAKAGKVPEEPDPPAAAKPDSPTSPPIAIVPDPKAS